MHGYLVAMIFLKQNVLVKSDLTSEDIKPRLLGHWGTCPGLVMIYAHRSVDLVVAVMAVLKAGATFSVIGELIQTQVTFASC